MTILIVDDDANLRMTLSAILQARGYASKAVGTAEAALHAVEEQVPEIAMIDLKLEDMSGLELMKKIRERSPGTECIVLTGHASQASAIEAVNLGAYSYVQKPYDVNQLLVTIRRVVEKRQAEEALRESEERYRGLFEGMPVGFYQATPDGQFLDVNPALVEMLGYPDPRTLMAVNVVGVCVDVDDRPGRQSLVEQQGEVRGREMQWRRYDGSPIWVRESARSVRDGEGRVLYFEGTVEDITERVRAEQERVRLLVAELEQRLLTETLREVASALNASLDREQVLKYILEYLAYVVEYDSAALMLVSGEKLKVVAHRSLRSLGQPSVPERIEVLPHVRQVLESYLPVVISDTAADSGWQRLASEEQIRCWLGVPLVVQGQVIGLLNLNKKEPGFYEKRHAELALTFANQAATAIQNAQLFDQTRRRAAQQEALNAIIAAGVAATDLPELLEIVLDHTLEALRLGMGAIWAAGQHAVRGFPAGFDAAIWEAVQDAGLEISKPIHVEDWQRLADDHPLSVLKPIASRAGVGASLLAPIVTEGEPVGGLALASREPQTWSLEELALIEAVGQQLGGAVERLHLLGRTRKQAHQVQQIISSVPEGVILLDPDLQVLVVNPAARQNLDALADAEWGETLTHLGGRPIAELLAPRASGLWHEVTVGDPSPQVFEVIARPVESGSAATGWVLVIRDVTLEREEQQRVHRQERLAAVGQLAAGIAHDFNNIMAVIVLYAGMSSRIPDLPAKVQERLKTISQQARRATDLIDRILDFSRRSVLERQPMDLVPFLKEQVKLLQRTLPESIQMDLTYGADDYTVHADLTRMQQVIMNLAVNARDAMPEGGRLRVRLEQVHFADRESVPVSEMEAGDWVQVMVQDTGAGIPAEVQPRIFEPFFTTKTHGKGSGLGLAQVYGIVKQHGGHIGLQSQVGQGTTFTVYLPALVAPTRQEIATSEEMT